MASIIQGADIKAHLGIDDSEDDAFADQCAAAASQAVTQFCNREFITTPIVSASARLFWPEEGHRYRIRGRVDIDDIWETTALVVKVDEGDDGTYETTLTLNTDFFLEPTTGRLNGMAWPYNRIRGINRTFPCYTNRPPVQVTAAWGWAAIPDAVKLAAQIEGAALFHRRQSPSGVIGGFADYTPVRVSRFEDPDVTRLLTPFRRSDTSLLVG